MKTLLIEWKHFNINGKTCERCSDTGENIRGIVKRLRRKCAGKGTRIVFTETKLTGKKLKQSNSIWLNGKPIEDLVPGAVAEENHCGSCSELAGKEVSCRTVRFREQTHEAIPENFIEQAACRVLHCCN